MKCWKRLNRQNEKQGKGAPDVTNLFVKVCFHNMEIYENAQKHQALFLMLLFCCLPYGCSDWPRRFMLPDMCCPDAAVKPPVCRCKDGEKETPVGLKRGLLRQPFWAPKTPVMITAAATKESRLTGSPRKMAPANTDRIVVTLQKAVDLLTGRTVAA